MSSTPLSGNVIRSPNGASFNEQQNKSSAARCEMCRLPDERSAHSHYLINTVCLHKETKEPSPATALQGRYNGKRNWMLAVKTEKESRVLER